MIKVLWHRHCSFMCSQFHGVLGNQQPAHRWDQKASGHWDRQNQFWDGRTQVLRSLLSLACWTAPWEQQHTGHWLKALYQATLSLWPLSKSSEGQFLNTDAARSSNKKLSKQKLIKKINVKGKGEEWDVYRDFWNLWHVLKVQRSQMDARLCARLEMGPYWGKSWEACWLTLGSSKQYGSRAGEVVQQLGGYWKAWSPVGRQLGKD